MSSFYLKSKRTPNSARPKGARNLTLRAEKARRRKEAEARQAAYSALSLEEKIAKVLARGGSAHELGKLLTKQLEKQQAELSLPGQGTDPLATQPQPEKKPKRQRKLKVVDTENS